MKDGFTKGTGNSRYLKSVANFLSQYPNYEAFAQALIAGTLPIDFNGINEDGWQQLGTALNKETLLSDQTAALFGLSADGVPDDAMALLGRFRSGLGNEYFWEKALLEERFDATNKSSFQFVSTFDSNISFTVGDGFYVDESTGKIALTNPQTQSFSVSSASNFNSLRGKYVSGIYFEGKYIDAVYFPTNATFNKFSSSPASISSSSATLYTNGWLEKTMVTYVNSSDPDAYPPAEPDGFLYTAIGQLGLKTRIESGSYVGTGTSGESLPTTLVFDFAPKLIVVVREDTYVDNFGFLAIVGQKYTRTTNSSTVNISVKGNTVSWYTSNADYQLNTSGRTFFYVAIG